VLRIGVYPGGFTVFVRIAIDDVDIAQAVKIGNKESLADVVMEQAAGDDALREVIAFVAHGVVKKKR
jgi:hypothetical protein